MFYKIDSTRVSFREYWWGCRNPLILLAWLIKVLRIPVPSSSDDPPVDCLQPFEVPEESLPEEVRARFAPLVQELTANGFHSPVCHAIADTGHSTKIYWMTFCHQSGQAFARIHHRIWTQTNPARVYLFPMFITSFGDGSFLWSTSGKADMAAPASCRMNRKVGASLLELWSLHQRESSRESNKSILQACTPDELRFLMERHHAAVRDFHLQRRVFRPLSEPETQQAAAMVEHIKTAEASGFEHAEVLAELERLHTKKPGWGAAIVILVVSMVLFLAAGATQWSWEFVLLLIPILLFHELGHYLAMKAFKYRNLRMFFIPFFGAAVSGQHYNVPGWKKVVVSLMGPLPGILLAIVLGVAGMLVQQPFLLKVALITLILNGFNLIPVLPLDGGWVMHALLFSRHYMLDVAFRFLAALALIVGGLLLGDRILWIIGIPLLIGLLPAYRMARIASELRKRALPPALPVDQRIPTQTAQVIIGEVKKAFQKGVTNRIIAQYTLQIFETLNARPPGWAATVGLLAVYGGSAVLALLFTALLVVGQQGDLRGFLAAAAQAPRYTAQCGAIETWRGAAANGFATSRNTLIATWTKSAEAEKTFRGLIAQLPPNAAVTRFGSTLLLSLPAEDDAARKKWLEHLQSRTKDLFVESTNYFGNVSLSCVAPDADAAARIETEADAYFAASATMFLLPPWASGLTSEQQQARELYVKAQKASISSWSSPESAAFQKRIAKAQRLGDGDQIKRLGEEHHAFQENLTRQALAKLRQETAGQSATSILDLYEAYQAELKNGSDDEEPQGTPLYESNSLKQLALRMGQLEMRGEKPAEGADRYSTRWGTVKRNGLLITFRGLSFVQAGEGVPAIAQWLCSKGCEEVDYEFRSGFDFGFLDDDLEETGNDSN